EMQDFLRRESRQEQERALREDYKGGETFVSQNPEEVSLIKQEWENLVAGLPKEQAEVLLRRELWEEDFEDIARGLGKSPVAVRKILSRAKAFLLKKEEDSERDRTKK